VSFFHSVKKGLYCPLVAVNLLVCEASKRSAAVCAASFSAEAKHSLYTCIQIKDVPTGHQSQEAWHAADGDECS
jgi:translation elongation factor P/translation initiation factor 5A